MAEPVTPPQRLTCPVCGKATIYQGTQDRIRFYRCDEGHISQVKP